MESYTIPPAAVKMVNAEVWGVAVHHSTTLMCHCEERSDVAISGRHLQPVQAIADRMQYCRGGDSRARRCTCARNRLPLKR